MSVSPLSFSLFDFEPVVAGFSTRLGGVSRAPWAELNLGLHVGDDETAVLENRRRWGQALDINPQHLVAGQQVHGTQIAVVTEADRGRGATSWSDALPQTDGLITQSPHVPLMVVVADCAVLYVYDPVHHAIGLAHAGWRGTLNDIAFSLLDTMNDQFGSLSEEVKVALSPAIGVECYEVGNEVVTAFQTKWGRAADQFFDFTLADRPHLDLKKTLQWQLHQLGVKPSQLEVSTNCPCHQTETFFSHRAEQGHTGRLAATMMLKTI
jgi:polyphenol oxidase